MARHGPATPFFCPTLWQVSHALCGGPFAVSIISGITEIVARETRDKATNDFVAITASYWQSLGLAPSAGMILGYLMVCEPAAQTQAELASALKISAGSVSTQLGMAVRIGLVERLRTPGDRLGRYQLPANMWTRLVLAEGERIRGLRTLAEAGNAVLPASRKDRITSLDLMVRFWEAEWPQIEQRFEDFVREE